MNEDRNIFGSASIQNLFGLLRVLFFFTSLIFFATNFSQGFHNINPHELAAGLRASNPLFAMAPEGLAVLVTSLTSYQVIRYIFAPLTAMVYVVLAGAYYIKDVYDLPDFKDALKYVVASTFSINYPVLRIDKGVKQLKKAEVNLIDRVGGPGIVLIEPGSAGIFQHLRGQSGTKIADTYFLAPFETIAHTVDLDEQQGDRDEIKSVTRDGIKVVIRDIHFRYRIKARANETANPSGIRTINDPYPFANDALMRMTFNLQVQNNGLESWNAAVERAVTGKLTDFVASHSIDFLTAPRKNDWNPRQELLDYVHSGTVIPLDKLGAQLTWIDVGHLEIQEESVDQERTSLWAADWLGDVNVARAYGEAKRLAYQELGRAEAQAELILSISDALSDANLTGDSKDNIRKLFLVRTAQILDAMKEKPKGIEEHS